MNTPDSSFDEQLRAELSERLGAVRASTDLTGPAVARAAAIRRRRRVATTAATALAVIGVAAPFVWWSVQGRGPDTLPAVTSSSAQLSTSTPPTTATSSTTATPTPTTVGPSTTGSAPPIAAPTYDTNRRSAVVGKVSFAGTIGSPGIPYVTEGDLRVLHTGDRTVALDLPSDALVAGVTGPLANGGLAVNTLLPGEGEWGVAFLDSAGKEIRRVPKANPSVISSRGDRLAYVRADGVVHLLDATGVELATLRRRVLPTGVVGDVVYANDVATGNAVAWDADTGSVRVVGKGRFGDVHGGTGTAVFWPAAEPTCFRLVEVRGATMTTRWTACGKGFGPNAFSPSGAYLVGAASRLDGGTPDRHRVMRTSDGAFVLDVDGSGSGLMLRDPVFTADEKSIVIPATDAELKLGLVRCGLDGTCRLAAQPLPVDTTHPSGIGFGPYYVLER
jgi:hypothetical protein